MTVLEVIPPDDVPAAVREEASRVLARHDKAWSEVTCAARVQRDEPGEGESWLMSMYATGVEPGARLFSKSSWAIGICRTNKHSKTVHHINITERAFGAAS